MKVFFYRTHNGHASNSNLPMEIGDVCVTLQDNKLRFYVISQPIQDGDFSAIDYLEESTLDYRAKVEAEEGILFSHDGLNDRKGQNEFIREIRNYFGSPVIGDFLDSVIYILTFKDDRFDASILVDLYKATREEQPIQGAGAQYKIFRYMPKELQKSFSDYITQGKEIGAIWIELKTENPDGVKSTFKAYRKSEGPDATIYDKIEGYVSEEERQKAINAFVPEHRKSAVVPEVNDIHVKASKSNYKPATDYLEYFTTWKCKADSQGKRCGLVILMLSVARLIKQSIIEYNSIVLDNDLKAIYKNLVSTSEKLKNYCPSLSDALRTANAETFWNFNKRTKSTRLDEDLFHLLEIDEYNNLFCKTLISLLDTDPRSITLVKNEPAVVHLELPKEDEPVQIKPQKVVVNKSTKTTVKYKPEIEIKTETAELTIEAKKTDVPLSPKPTSPASKFEEYLHKITHMKVATIKGKVAPYKALLMLTCMYFVRQRGRAGAIPLTLDFRKLYGSLGKRLVTEEFIENITMPLTHLADGFWHLSPKTNTAYLSSNYVRLSEMYKGVALDPELQTFILDDYLCQKLIDAITNKYLDGQKVYVNQIGTTVPADIKNILTLHDATTQQKENLENIPTKVQEQPACTLKGKLRVTLNDGTVICYSQAKTTFEKVISLFITRLVNTSVTWRNIGIVMSGKRIHKNQIICDNYCVMVPVNKEHKCEVLQELSKVHNLGWTVDFT